MTIILTIVFTLAAVGVIAGWLAVCWWWAKRTSPDRTEAHYKVGYIAWASFMCGLALFVIVLFAWTLAAKVV